MVRGSGIGDRSSGVIDVVRAWSDRGARRYRAYLMELPVHLEQLISMDLDETTIDAVGNVAIAYLQFRARGKLRGREELRRGGWHLPPMSQSCEPAMSGLGR